MPTVNSQPELPLAELLPHDLRAALVAPTRKKVLLSFRRAAPRLREVWMFVVKRLLEDPTRIISTRDALSDHRQAKGKGKTPHNNISPLMTRILEAAGFRVGKRPAKQTAKMPGSWFETEAKLLPDELLALRQSKKTAPRVRPEKLPLFPSL
jgi:hypothetical protein